MNLTLVIFRFDPTQRKQIECAFISNTDFSSLSLPTIKLYDEDEPSQVINKLLHNCLVLDPSWAKLEIVDLVRIKNSLKHERAKSSDGITCLYKISVPDTIVASKSINWIPYDKLEEMVSNKAEIKLVRRSYHSY